MLGAEMPNMPRSISKTLMFGLHFGARFLRPMTLGVRSVVIDGENKVFLVRHSYIDGWHLPGGGVEPGETVLQAMTRELLEEGAIEQTGPPDFHGIFFNNQYSKRDHVAVYVIREFRVAGVRKPDWEIRETGFFPAGDLPPQTGAATRRRIGEIVNGVQKSEFW